MYELTYSLYQTVDHCIIVHACTKYVKINYGKFQISIT